MKYYKIEILLIIIFSLVLNRTINSQTKKEIRQWEKINQKISKADTSDSKLRIYKNFIEKYPIHFYVTEALEEVAGIEFFKIEEKDNETAYLDFIKKYPKTSWTKKARNQIENIWLQKVVDQGTVEGYREFLKRFPQKETLSPAGLKLEEVWFEHALKAQTIESMELFLKNFPIGEYAKKAGTELEKRCYLDAKNKALIPAYQDYLNRYPDGKHRNEIIGLLHSAINNLGAVKLEIYQSFPGGADILAGAPYFQTLLKKYTPLKIVSGTSVKTPLTFEIKVEGIPISQKYSLFGLPGGTTHYSGASIRGSILLRHNNMIICSETFSGYKKPPKTIQENSYTKKSYAPFLSAIKA